MKKAMLRGLLGFPVGVCIGYTITIITSLIWAKGYYSPVVPEMADMCGSQINAVMLQYLLCGVMGFVMAAMSVVWENDRLSLAAQSAINFVVVTLVMLPIAYVCYWMEHSLIGVLQYMGIFAGIYVSIWLSMYFTYKAKIDDINKNITK